MLAGGWGGLFAQSMDISWQLSVGGSGSEVAADLLALESGGYLVCGSTLSADGDVAFNHGSQDVYVMEFSASGELEWTQTFGGSGSDIPSALIQTADGGYLLTATSGSTDGDVAGMHGESDVWLLKLNAEKELEWQQCYGGSLAETAADVVENDWGFLFCATTNSSDGDVSENHGSLGDYWLVQVDNDGNIIWEETYGGTGQEWAHTMLITQDDQVVIAGESVSIDGDISMHKNALDGWIIKVAQDDGDLLWERSVGKFKDDHIADITEDVNGNLVFVGHTQSGFNGYHGYVDVWVGMLRPNGYEKKTKVFGGSHPDLGFSIVYDSSTGYLICGYTSSKNGDVGEKIGSNDVWLLQLDQQANLVWEQTYGGTQLDFGAKAIITETGIVFCASSYSNDVDCTDNHGMGDIWLVQLEDAGMVRRADTGNEVDMQVFPIPTSGSFHIILPEKEAGQHCQVVIYDRQGLVCRHLLLTADAGAGIQVNLNPSLPAGVYTLLVKSGSGEFIGQIIITEQ
jgi:hypothetical protein